MNVRALAREILTAYEGNGAIAELPSARAGGLDMAQAYAVEAEFLRLRIERGRAPAGRKVGFANRAMWRALKLESLVWAHMYDDTVHRAATELAVSGYLAPKIEPEIVFRLGGAPGQVEWLAAGFEIIDCPFPGWQCQATDFVAAFGFHRALIVGEPLRVGGPIGPELFEQLGAFTLRLLKSGELVEKGAGRNSLKNPALCLAELGRITELHPGELVSSGTLTGAHPIAPGETWSVEVEGLPVSGLHLRTL